jgi:hypothetical protein
VTEMSTIELWSEIYGGMTSLQAVMPSITVHVYYNNE